MPRIHFKNGEPTGASVQVGPMRIHFQDGEATGASLDLDRLGTSQRHATHLPAPADATPLLDSPDTRGWLAVLFAGPTVALAAFVTYHVATSAGAHPFFALLAAAAAFAGVWWTLRRVRVLQLLYATIVAGALGVWAIRAIAEATGNDWIWGFGLGFPLLTFAVYVGQAVALKWDADERAARRWTLTGWAALSSLMAVGIAEVVVPRPPAGAPSGAASRAAASALAESTTPAPSPTASAPVTSPSPEDAPTDDPLLAPFESLESPAPAPADTSELPTVPVSPAALLQTQTAPARGDTIPTSRAPR